MNQRKLAKELQIPLPTVRQLLDGLNMGDDFQMLDLVVALTMAINAANEPEPELKQDKLLEEITRLRLQNFKRQIAIDVDEGSKLDIDQLFHTFDPIAMNLRGTADNVARRSIWTGDELVRLFSGPLLSFENAYNSLFDRN